MSAKKATKNTQDNAAHGGCSRAHCQGGEWQTCNAPATQYVLKLDSLYHSKSGFVNHKIVAALCPKHAKELKARICPANA